MIRKTALITGLITAISGHAQACGIVDSLQVKTDTATCSTFLSQTGSTGTSCHWPFDYRDPAAVEFHNSVWATLQSCRAGHALDDDALVNHPDSYDLRQWVTDQGTYAVSLKDKGRLNKTYVFLRYEAR